MSNPDMSQYLGIYLDEGREQLELLETHILEMERGDHSTEMLQILFRAAHTLKGSSRAMGFTAVGDLYTSDGERPRRPSQRSSA